MFHLNQITDIIFHLFFFNKIIGDFVDVPFGLLVVAFGNDVGFEDLALVLGERDVGGFAGMAGVLVGGDL